MSSDDPDAASHVPAHRRSAQEFARFVTKLHQQALESQEERWPLYLKAGLRNARRLLDVGCGSGAVTLDLLEACPGTVVGVDASEDMLETARVYLAQPHGRRVRLVEADGRRLPFSDGSFDAVVCNLFLMWAGDPWAAVREMARVVRPGGVVLATLEPDFGGKIHWPEDPKVDPIFRGGAIRRRGGDPHIGRKLRALFVRAGLETEVGIGNQRIWSPEEDRRSFERARDLYRSMLAKHGLSEAEIAAWEARQTAEFEEGTALNFFPQFYAIGKKAEA